MDKEAEMREILAGLLDTMLAYGDLRARQERERCAKVAEAGPIGANFSVKRIASAIRSLKDEPETGQ